MGVDTTNMIGRVAKLEGLVGKPELNGRLVVLKDFSDETQRFQARLLSDPNSTAASVIVCVKRTSFVEQFPCAPVVPGSDINGIEAGSVVDFAQCADAPNESTTSNNLDPLLLRSSCVVRGKAPSSADSIRPTMSISQCVSIVPIQNGIVEFEDILFSGIGDRVRQRQVADHGELYHPRLQGRWNFGLSRRQYRGEQVSYFQLQIRRGLCGGSPPQHGSSDGHSHHYQ